jgi:hypothetical protein
MQPDPIAVYDVGLLGAVDRAIALPARAILVGADGASFVLAATVLAWSGMVLQAGTGVVGDAIFEWLGVCLLGCGSLTYVSSPKPFLPVTASLVVFQCVRDFIRHTECDVTDELPNFLETGL